MDQLRIERRLEWSGILVTAGLVVQLGVSTWIHPLAFVAFLLIACPLVVAGMLTFLWALVTAP